MIAAPRSATDHSVEQEPENERASLRDGQQIRIRKVVRDDRQRLLEFMQRLTPESRRTRFFSAGCDLPHAADWAGSADQIEHIGILALDQDDITIGHAACCRLGGARAEIAVEIDESHRHQGLAPILIARLAREAEHAGVRTFVAEVLPENLDMLAVFRDGFDAQQTTKPDEIDIEFPTTVWRVLRRRFDR